MDLLTVDEIRMPTTRDELAFGPGVRPLGGGTWLFSEEQPGLTALVDLTSLGWEAVTRSDTHLTIAATCTIAALTRIPAEPGWHAHALLAQCANALLASFKVWNVATVGGNVALGLPAGAMTSLMVGLEATALVWTADGGARREPVASLVTGAGTTTLRQGDVLRALEIPLVALRGTSGFRRISLSPYGRSGALVTSLRGVDGTFIVTVTAATTRPVQLRFAGVPSPDELTDACAGIDCWYDDAHGAPDWRRAVTARLAEELRAEAEADGDARGPAGAGPA